MKLIFLMGLLVSLGCRTQNARIKGAEDSEDQTRYRHTFIQEAVSSNCNGSGGQENKIVWKRAEAEGQTSGDLTVQTDPTSDYTLADNPATESINQGTGDGPCPYKIGELTDFIKHISKKYPKDSSRPARSQESLMITDGTNPNKSPNGINCVANEGAMQCQTAAGNLENGVFEVMEEFFVSSPSHSNTLSEGSPTGDAHQSGEGGLKGREFIEAAKAIMVGSNDGTTAEQAYDKLFTPSFSNLSKNSQELNQVEYCVTDSSCGDDSIYTVKKPLNQICTKPQDRPNKFCFISGSSRNKYTASKIYTIQKPPKAYLSCGWETC